MPSFMIGDILEQKSSIQSSLNQDGEDSGVFDWAIPKLKDLSPIDLCTRLPFSVSPWPSTQQTNVDHRLTPQGTNHKIDSMLTSGEACRCLLRSEDLYIRQVSTVNNRSCGGIQGSVTTTSGGSTLNEDSGVGKCKKTRKARTAFSDHQLNELERTFERQKYLSVQDRMQLAEKLHLSDMQVKTWYQNRRTKWKRQASVGMELFTEATSNVNRFFQLQNQSPRLTDDHSGQRQGLLEPLSALMMRAAIEGVEQPPHDILSLFSTTNNPSQPPDLNVLKCIPLPPPPPPQPIQIQMPTKTVASNLPKHFDHFSGR